MHKSRDVNNNKKRFNTAVFAKKTIVLCIMVFFLMGSFGPFVCSYQVDPHFTSAFDDADDSVMVPHVFSGENQFLLPGWRPSGSDNQFDSSSLLTLGNEESLRKKVECVFENPSNGATGIAVALSGLQFSLVTEQDDVLSYTVYTVPDIIGGPRRGTDVNSGSHITIPIVVSPLLADMYYTWHVDVTNCVEWINKTFNFTTKRNIDPIVVDVYPHNEDATYNPRLSVTVFDENNDLLSVSFKTNASGAWQTVGMYQGYSGVFSHDAVGMDVKGKQYYWSVNIFDGTVWVNETYHFIALPFVFQWSFDIETATTNVGALAADVTGDGVYEIFAFGNNKLFCLNGSTGAVIWSYFNGYIGEHSQAEIGDLNNDGIAEIVISAGTRTIALHANNGSLYWIVIAKSSNKNLIIADLDGNRYPYVFIASDDVKNGLNGTGRLRKLRGTDGAILAETFAWRPCYGSLSLADLDNDGKFELLMTDRSSTYAAGEPGRGIQCYDAETLELLWYQDSVTCSSHSAALIDVNNDGVLDVVVLNQVTNAGIYVIDGATWDKINEKCQHNIPGFTAHSQFSIHDIDGDGNLELITNSDGPAMVWDLGRWGLDATLATAFEPPMMGNVFGDDKLEIILARYFSNIINIYDQSYNLIETIPIINPTAKVLVQDIDNDGRNELIVMSKSVCTVFKTSGRASEQKPRTTSSYYSERRTGVATYVPPPGAPQPIIKKVTPVNNAQDVPVNPVIGAWVVDFHYDLMNITISTNASGTWQDIATYTDVGNGWYNITTSSMNQPKTTYYWRVSAVDPYSDNLTTVKTYHFTTSTPPEISDVNAIPAVVNSGEQVNISAHVTDNDSVKDVKIQIISPDGTVTNTSLQTIDPGWVVLRYDSFETSFGNYASVGTYCTRIINATYAYDGNAAVLLRHYRGKESSLFLAEPINGLDSRYTSLKVDFWFYTRNFGILENFWVKYWDGQHWRIVDNYIKPGSLGYLPGYKLFDNGAFYHGVTWINATDYPFHNDMKIRFECDASSSSDHLYIDHIYINATTATAVDYYLNTTFLQPGTYHYSIWAEDRSGNSISSELYTFAVREKYQVSLQKEWNLISLPISESFEKNDFTLLYNGVIYSWSDAVNSTIVNNFFYEWDVAQQNYTVKDTLHPGKGYWIYANQACSLIFYHTISEADDIGDLSTKWNLIGIAINNSITIEDITVCHDNLTYSWNEAVTHGIVIGFFFVWNAENAKYEIITDIIYPGDGYWVYAYHPCVLN